MGALGSEALAKGPQDERPESEKREQAEHQEQGLAGLVARR
jgi:hypothetical protein